MQQQVCVCVRTDHRFLAEETRMFWPQAPQREVHLTLGWSAELSLSHCSAQACACSAAVSYHPCRHIQEMINTFLLSSNNASVIKQICIFIYCQTGNLQTKPSRTVLCKYSRPTARIEHNCIWQHVFVIVSCLNLEGNTSHNVKSYNGVICAVGSGQ